jgi:hypothetical protein
MSYNELPWLPLCGGLTLLGLIASWVVWRRRGAAAGLRGVAWSLLPLAAYLTKAVRMLWQIGSAIGNFASSLILSPQVWAGVAVTGLAVVLFVVSGTLRGRTRKPGGRGADGPGRPASPPAGAPPGKALKPAKSKAPAADDDLGDVADILRRHGIH